MMIGKKILVFLAATALLGALRPGSAAAQEVDVSVSTTVEPASPIAGSPITYTHRIAVVAGSATTATNVILTDVLPAGTTYSAGSTACTLACERRVICALGEVSGPTSVAIVVTPAAPGPITNVASVEADEYELVVSNNISITDLVVAPAKHSIFGTVRLNGAGLFGVLMTLDGGTALYTDLDGHYTFFDLASGMHRVIPTHRCYNFSPEMADVLIEGQDVTGVDFIATPKTYSISGTVTLGGVGLGGVLVSASSKWATTDGTGRYTISGLTSGPHRVTPTHGSYNFSPEMADVSIDCQDVTGVDFIATPKTYSISGTVTLGGVGLGGVLVSANATWATTDGTGHYTIFGLTSGPHRVTPTHGSYNFSPEMADVLIEGQDVTGVDFIATPKTYSISGTVTLGGVGLGGVLVSANATWATTDGTGHYTIEGLVRGSYTVGAALNGYVFAPEMSVQTVNDADISGVNFTAALQTFSISGTVSLNGVGRAGVVVTAGSASATTNASGAYTISGLSNGTYVVTPFLKGGTEFSPANATRTISGANEFGVDFAVILPTYSISGAISLRSGEGVAGITVRAVRTNGTGQSNPVSGTSDRDGAYSIPGLVAGTYTVTPASAAYTFSPIDRSIALGAGPLPSADFEATPR